MEIFLFKETRVFIDSDDSFFRNIQIQTVFIKVGANIGAGLILESGVILTSIFVVGNEILAKVIFFDGTETDGVIAFTDKKTMLAAIKPNLVPNDLISPIQFGETRAIGDPLFVANHTQANWVVSEGTMLYGLKLPERRSDELIVDGYHPAGFNGGGIYDQAGNLVGLSLGTKPRTATMFSARPEYIAEFAQKTSSI